MSTSEQATSFGQASDIYERARPTYPAEAVAFLAPVSAVDVADVGAGTGKLTRALLAEGRTVTAVDPDPGMLATLADAVPGVATHVGRAEELPLADDSVDLVTFGQAWHWVDVPRASREIGRVLRPGGALGLIWNIWSESTEWVREFADVVQRSNAELYLKDRGPQVDAPFGEGTAFTVEWERPMTVDGLVELAASRSPLITATPAAREAMLVAVRDLGERVVASEGALVLPYVTRAFRFVIPVG